MDSIEVVGFLFAVIGIYYSTQRKITYWPLSIVSSIAYLFFFYKIGLYADALLQLFFIASALYAWAAWKKNIAANHALQIKRASIKYLLGFGVLASIMGGVLGYCLQQFTDASLPYLDSLLFSFSIFATYLSAKAILQNWIAWILINAFYVGMYIYKEAFLTSVLYFILIILASIGYLNWKKHEQAGLH